jgi:uncharacterized protein YaaQ
MKLMFVIVRDVDAEAVAQALIEDGYGVTRVASTGGFLRRGNVTLMVGLEPGKVGPAVALIGSCCGPADAFQHRATVFVVNMSHSEQI